MESSLQCGSENIESLGRLLIVDDDPISSGILGLRLADDGYEIHQVSSGEECLGCISSFEPAVVLLDIEMPGGIDGYTTCTKIREQFDHINISIIFLSGHDSLEERLRAYDVGGDDFVAKPFNALEIQRKISLAMASRKRRSQWEIEKKTLEESADIAMQGFNELGAILKFTRGALSCRNLIALAELVIASMSSSQCTCHVQLRGSVSAGTVTMTPSGVASPFEESVIELMRQHDRIFQFASRMIINYETVSLLITDMPKSEELGGRIRDYAAMVAEAAEDAVENISMRADAMDWARELRSIGQSSRERMVALGDSYQSQQSITRAKLEQMAEKVEDMYYQFGLTDHQEAAISDVIRSANDEIIQLYDTCGKDFDGQFSQIVEELTRASSFDIDTEEQVSVTLTEVW